MWLRKQYNIAMYPHGIVHSDISLSQIIRFKVIFRAKLYFYHQEGHPHPPTSVSGPDQGLFLFKGGFSTLVAGSGFRLWVTLNSV